MVRKQFNVNSTLDNFFTVFLRFMSPYHGMTKRELRTAAEFLRQRYLLGKKISDQVVLDRNVLGTETRRTVREHCGLSSSCFQMTIRALRKKGFIKDGFINPKFIPYIDDLDEGTFDVMIKFSIDNAHKPEDI